MPDGLRLLWLHRTQLRRVPSLLDHHQQRLRSRMAQRKRSVLKRWQKIIWFSQKTFPSRNRTDIRISSKRTNSLDEISTSGGSTMVTLIMWLDYINKVNRCLARYSPRHNHQPTHQHGTKWASNGQKCQFRAKLGRFWAKNPFFYWRNQKFCYPHNGKPT